MLQNQPSKPPNSIPSLQQTFTLETLHAIKVFKRCYRLVDYHLYLASVIVRVRGNSEEFKTEIDAVVSMIDSMLEEERTYFDAHLEALKTEFKIKPQDLELTYSHPETVVGTMRTPRAKRYLECLFKLETACKIINAAWFEGRIDDVQKLDLGLELQRRLIKLASRINILAKGLARRVINQDDGENRTYDRVLVQREMDIEGSGYSSQRSRSAST